MRNNIIVYTIFMMCSIVSCDDIIEKNIANEKLTPLAPSDGYATFKISQSLSWNEIDGATQYRLLIASPSLDSANIIVLDTVISNTHFTASFPTGKSQWCVKALNAGYETEYTCRTIEITNISKQHVVMLAPSEGYASLNVSQTLSWNELEGATQYRLIVAAPTLSNADHIHIDTLLTKSNATIKFPAGKSQWCVKSINDGYETEYTCRSIDIGNITVQNIGLLAPAEGHSSLESNQTLSWNKMNGATQYRLIIASPQLHNANVIVLDTLLTKSQFAARFPIGKSQWCVKSINAAYESEYTCRTIEIRE